MRYFEDFQVGERIELGSRMVTEEEIIAIAWTIRSTAISYFSLRRRSTRTTED